MYEVTFKIRDDKYKIVEEELKKLIVAYYVEDNSCISDAEPEFKYVKVIGPKHEIESIRPYINLISRI